MTWLRSRPRWQLVALVVVLTIAVWSAIEALPTGRIAFTSGRTTSGHLLELVRGWTEASGAIHLEYMDDRTGQGLVIDGMDAGGSRGTVTEFPPSARVYADLADCDASFQEVEPGTIEGRIDCPVAQRAPSDGSSHSIRYAFTATR